MDSESRRAIVMKEFFEAIESLNPNLNNLTVTVIRGQGFGEKAVLSSGNVVWISDTS